MKTFIRKLGTKVLNNVIQPVLIELSICGPWVFEKDMVVSFDSERTMYRIVQCGDGWMMVRISVTATLKEAWKEFRHG